MSKRIGNGDISETYLWRRMDKMEIALMLARPNKRITLTVKGEGDDHMYFYDSHMFALMNYFQVYGEPHTNVKEIADKLRNGYVEENQ